MGIYRRWPPHRQRGVDSSFDGRELACSGRKKRPVSSSRPIQFCKRSHSGRQSCSRSPNQCFYFVPSYPSDIASASASAASYSAIFSASELSTMLLLPPESHPIGARSKKAIAKVSVQVFINPSKKRRESNQKEQLHSLQKATRLQLRGRLFSKNANSEFAVDHFFRGARAECSPETVRALAAGSR